MAQIPKLMARLQFGLQFNTVPRRPGRPSMIRNIRGMNLATYSGSD